MLDESKPDLLFNMVYPLLYLQAILQGWTLASRDFRFFALLTAHDRVDIIPTDELHDCR